MRTHPPNIPKESARRPFERTTLAFWVAFLVRVAYVTLAHTYRIRPFPDHFEFGWEMGRIARSLAAGHGFADPFKGHTGSTAWVTPLYPLLMAFVFKLTGVYTLTSAWILLALNSLFSALTVFPIAAIARRWLRCFRIRPRRKHPALGRLVVGALSGGHAVRRPLGLGDQPEHLALYHGLCPGPADASALP